MNHYKSDKDKSVNKEYKNIKLTENIYRILPYVFFITAISMFLVVINKEIINLSILKKALVIIPLKESLTLIKNLLIIIIPFIGSLVTDISFVDDVFENMSKKTVLIKNKENGELIPVTYLKIMDNHKRLFEISTYLFLTTSSIIAANMINMLMTFLPKLLIFIFVFVEEILLKNAIQAFHLYRTSL